MILQALYEYYQRKAADPESTIAPRGLEWKEIPYLILIDKKESFGTTGHHRGVGKQKRAKNIWLLKVKGVLAATVGKLQMYFVIISDMY